MEHEYDRVVRRIESERYAICAVNAIFALLGIASWLDLSALALSALVLILVLNATFPFEHRRRLLRALHSRAEFDKVSETISYERYAICLINGIFALLGIVSWFGAPYLVFTALILILVLNATFPVEHHRRLREARSKQLVHRLTESNGGHIGSAADQEHDDKLLHHLQSAGAQKEGLRRGADASGLAISSATKMQGERPIEIVRTSTSRHLALECGLLVAGIVAVITSAVWANR